MNNKESLNTHILHMSSNNQKAPISEELQRFFNGLNLDISYLKKITQDMQTEDTTKTQSV